MAFVQFVPSTPPSGRAYELGTRLKETIDGFRREHPGVTGTEIRQAMDLATKGTLPGQAFAGPQRVALLIAVVLLILFGVLAFLFLEFRR